MLPLLWLIPILIGITALSDDDKQKLVKLLPSFIKLMYAFANVDKIVKEEEDKAFYATPPLYPRGIRDPYRRRVIR